jgi:hypothetical protein
MRVVLLAALALALALPGCEYPLDSCARSHTCQGSPTDSGGSGMPMCMASTSAACMAATSHSDLTWIQANVFDKQCTFSGCHNGANTAAGKVDLRAGKSYAHLVNFSSAIDTSRKLVVASDGKSSYLEVMLGIIAGADATPPAAPPRSDVGWMPQDNGGNLLCCQKLDAIDRWIGSGAMNN